MEKRKILLLLVLLTLIFGSLSAQNPPSIDTLGVKVYFRQGYSTLDPSFRDNGLRLAAFTRQVADLCRDTMCRVQSVRIVGFSSPDGSSVRNKRLAEKRAGQIAGFLRSSIDLPDSLFMVDGHGVGWQRLACLVETSDMPYRDEVLDILYHTPEWIIRNGKVVDGRKRQLGMLHGGRAWWYMYERFFPELRGSDVRVVCQVVRRPEPVVRPEVCDTVAPAPRDPIVPVQCDTTAPCDTVRTSDVAVPLCKPFYMALKTNLLYDVALVPNVGAEFYVGRGWSVGGSWMYAWWKSDKRHRYWRTYGGELDIRKYFGRRAQAKPLTGHHLGLYGQMLTYDFETGGTGYQSKLSYGVGIEYGYSLPLGRRLNLDFGIGIGYLGGEYKKYDPIDGHYVWKETKQRHWFGPTKAEVSLIWLIGRGNYNEKKGGKR